jgi:hypothetical protein
MIYHECSVGRAESAVFEIQEREGEQAVVGAEKVQGARGMLVAAGGCPSEHRGGVQQHAGVPRP